MIDRNTYIQLNNSYKHALTYSFENLGFYSNFNNMILTMAFCLKHGLRFRVYCKSNDLFSPKGWESLFQSMGCETKNPFFGHFNYRKKLVTGTGLNEWVHMAVNSLYPLLTGNNLVNAAFSDSRTFWFHKEVFDIKELGFRGSLRELCGELVNMAYVFNDASRSIIDRYKRSVILPERYVSMQIRRGDKDTERELLPISLYMERTAGLTPVRNAFVLTDDYTVIEELARDYPEWRFYTLTQPSERGYHYNKDNRGGSRDAWLKLFAAMEVLTAADLFVGTVSANPGMFAGMVMAADKVAYLDAADWILI